MNGFALRFYFLHKATVAHAFCARAKRGCLEKNISEFVELSTTSIFQTQIMVAERGVTFLEDHSIFAVSDMQNCATSQQPTLTLITPTINPRWTYLTRLIRCPSSQASIHTTATFAVSLLTLLRNHTYLFSFSITVRCKLLT